MKSRETLKSTAAQKPGSFFKQLKLKESVESTVGEKAGRRKRQLKRRESLKSTAGRVPEGESFENRGRQKKRRLRVAKRARLRAIGDRHATVLLS